MKFIKVVFPVLLLIPVLIFSACNEEDCCVLPPTANGFFVVNEGAFQNGTTSLSFFNEDENVMYNNVFASVNSRGLGDQSQSMAIHNGLGYVVVQNTGAIEVIDPDSYQSIATITEGIESPRFFIGISETKGYVSDWGNDGISGSVRIIDLSTMTVTGEIPTGSGANRMLRVGDLIYVTNSGGLSFDNRLSVIDTRTDRVVNTLEVGDNPNSIVRDSEGNLWILSAGKLAFTPPDFSIDEENSTPGSLTKLNESNQEIVRLTLEGLTYNTANNLVISSDDQLYFTYDDQVFSMGSNQSELPQTAWLDRSFYGLAIHPQTNQILGCEALSFTAAGNIVFFTPQGDETGTVAAGIAPNGVAFK